MDNDLTYGSVLELEADKTPEDITNYEARIDLMLAIRDIIEAEGYTQKDLKEYLGMSQPRVSNLLNGHVDKFSLGKLVEILDKLGFHMEFKYKKTKKTARIQLSFEHDMVPA